MHPLLPQTALNVNDVYHLHDHNPMSARRPHPATFPNPRLACDQCPRPSTVRCPKKLTEAWKQHNLSAGWRSSFFLHRGVVWLTVPRVPLITV